MLKIREKSLVIKSEGYNGLMKEGTCGKGGKYILDSRIEFPDPKLVTLDTSHGHNTMFLKKCPKKL